MLGANTGKILAGAYDAAITNDELIFSRCAIDYLRTGAYAKLKTEHRRDCHPKYSEQHGLPAWRPTK